jgi:hypothetical protein
MKILIYSFLLLLFFASTAFSSDKITLPCEVMESSQALQSISGKTNGIRYALIHHANDADRETLSRWLKAHGGTEVKFIVNGEEHEGILCRLAHCFGRGLLIYKADVKPEKRAIINVILPLTGTE